MILADKIINERKKNGWSQEELAGMLGVSRQSISKWEGAQAVPDLQRILKMAEIFGVSTDYLLKDEFEPENALPESYSKNPEADSPDFRTVTLNEADEFLKIQEKTASLTALGVSLCIISPALLIFLAGFIEYNSSSENLCVALGLVALLVLVAIAVFLFISSSSKNQEYEFLEKEVFETAYGVTGMVKEKQKSYAPTHSARLSLGVMLCILSVIPLISLAIFFEDKEYILTASVSLLLCIVAAGVNLIVRTSIISGGFKKLLQENDYSVKQKKEKAYLDPIETIYWTVVLAGYLTWSFITNKWGITWIVWPIAGVLFSALVAILKLVHQKNN
ncbi:MAG: helix-turn-helix transcriptional regulator [Oscillospiraceae bacterium]|nr:helix-turn-helix transcriptional regulator [Oscillospiraceae bacterium]